MRDFHMAGLMLVTILLLFLLLLSTVVGCRQAEDFKRLKDELKWERKRALGEMEKAKYWRVMAADVEFQIEYKFVLRKRVSK